MDRAVADLTNALLDMALPQPGEHVLDIGCGAGTTVLELARASDRAVTSLAPISLTNPWPGPANGSPRPGCGTSR